MQRGLLLPLLATLSLGFTKKSSEDSTRWCSHVDKTKRRLLLVLLANRLSQAIPEESHIL